ncbi:hypothetical protein [Guyparkeria sp. TX1]|uniref:hypothetical protein n=1 Tax=Guyparkeria sp. TX1 TaxID=3115001 RepID=UPI003977253F
MENKIIFWASFIFLITAAATFGYQGKLGAMALSVVPGALGMAFSRLEMFTRIKGAGFEAELRRAVDEAYATTSSVKELAAELTKAINAIIGGEGRWGGIGLKRKLQIIKAIDQSLRKIGLSDEDIRGTHDTFNKYLEWDHGLAIINQIQKNRPSNNELRQELNKKHDHSRLWVAPPEDFRSILSSFEISDPESKEKIEDLSFFIRTHKLRRPETWDQ